MCSYSNKYREIISYSLEMCIGQWGIIYLSALLTYYIIFNLIKLRPIVEKINNNYERTKNLIQSIYLIKYAANVLITFLSN